MNGIVTLGEVLEVSEKGTLAFPGNEGRITGRVVPAGRPAGPQNGFLALSSGKKIPWIPADQIKW